MFIKVMFGARSFVLVNTSCRLVNLTAHLRQKAGLLPDVTLALLAEDGNLVSLEEDPKEAASGAPTMGSSLLKERATYVLVRIISKRERAWPPPAMSPYWRTWMTTTQSWQVSVRAQPGGRAQLLPSLYQQDFLGLPEELRRLAGLSSAGHDRRKRMGTRRGHHEQSPASRSRKSQVHLGLPANGSPHHSGLSRASVLCYPRCRWQQGSPSPSRALSKVTDCTLSDISILTPPHQPGSSLKTSH
ncbi:uncharacterized protein C22orf15 homolog isoform X2 [Cebus imitator]|uniref:uncharacterized protein C22orf15 homolog isoform X2 n=1 Tax=Cebus imitator TaxID=2715852 RepID=UPI00080A10C2|nr:uncharacterized protein C22orf15 homolog isoform X2 [Cebus imitator]